MKYFNGSCSYLLYHGFKEIARYDTYQEMIEDLFIRELFPDMDDGGTSYGPHANEPHGGDDVHYLQTYFPVLTADLKTRTRFCVVRTPAPDNATVQLQSMVLDPNPHVAWLAKLELSTQ